MHDRIDVVNARFGIPSALVPPATTTNAPECWDCLAAGRGQGRADGCPHAPNFQHAVGGDKAGTNRPTPPHRVRPGEQIAGQEQRWGMHSHSPGPTACHVRRPPAVCCVTRRAAAPTNPHGARSTPASSRLLLPLASPAAQAAGATHIPTPHPTRTRARPPTAPPSPPRHLTPSSTNQRPLVCMSSTAASAREAAAQAVNRAGPAPGPAARSKVTQVHISCPAVASSCCRNVRRWAAGCRGGGGKEGGAG